MEKKNSVLQTKGITPVNSSSMARGIRNNNPFNLIKTKISWLGKLTGLFNSESKFEQFTTLELGIRAGLLNLRNGYRNKGINTPYKIINKYAPLSDNSQPAQKKYIESVAKSVFGFSTSIHATLSTPVQWVVLAQSILTFENGKSPVSYLQLTKINNDQKIII